MRGLILNWSLLLHYRLSFFTSYFHSRLRVDRILGRKNVLVVHWLWNLLILRIFLLLVVDLLMLIRICHLLQRNLDIWDSRWRSYSL